MNNLAQTIEYLLLNHNSVIVPGLGAFTRCAFPSQWLEEEELFLPPVCHVRFNADVFQDSQDVFLNALSQIFQVRLEEAEEMCRRMVADFHKVLVVEGSVDFGSIGLFTLEDDAEITMSSYECGITSPVNYGLDTLHFATLSSLEKGEQLPEIEVMEDVREESIVISLQEQKTEAEAPEEETPLVLPAGPVAVSDSKYIVIRIPRAVAHYTLVAAASVLLFFLLTPSIGHREAAHEVRQATTNLVLPITDSNGVLVDDVDSQAASEVKQRVDLVACEGLVEQQKTMEGKVEVEPEATEQVTVGNALGDNQIEDNYCIVLASGVTRHNAEAYIENLKQMNIKARLYNNGKMLRVVIAGFENQAEAYSMNSQLHKMDASFKSTWVMQL